MSDNQNVVMEDYFKSVQSRLFQFLSNSRGPVTSRQLRVTVNNNYKELDEDERLHMFNMALMQLNDKSYIKTMGRGTDRHFLKGEFFQEWSITQNNNN